MSTPEEIIDTETVDAPPKELSEALAVSQKSLGIAPSSASASIAAQLVAETQARYLMAERHPRDMVKVREALLTICDDPVFAKMARYRKPVGRNAAGEMEYIEGLSVRFAEVLAGTMGNLMIGGMILLDDAERRVIRVAGTDLERNLFDYRDVAVRKAIERRKPKPGQKILGSRLNSEGKTVFEVEATEDEINIKANANISKAYRNVVLRFLPPEIKLECDARLKKTVKEEAAKQPEEARSALVAAFAGKGVTETDLAGYIGHPIDAITLDEIVDLRALYLALKMEDTTWAEVMEMKRGSISEAPAAPSSKAAEIKEILAKRKEELKEKS